MRHLDMDDFRFIGALDDESKIRPKPEAGYKTVEQGAATLVWCAASRQPPARRHGGVYCEDCEIVEVLPGGSDGGGVRPWAIDTGLAERLWALSERLTGIEFKCGE